MEVLRTGSGFWSALVWVATALGSFLIIWLFSRAFESGYKKGTDQTDPFLSGKPPGPGPKGDGLAHLLGLRRGPQGLLSAARPKPIVGS
jgi:hypothetical protein